MKWLAFAPLLGRAPPILKSAYINLKKKTQHDFRASLACSIISLLATSSGLYKINYISDVVQKLKLLGLSMDKLMTVEGS